jgi:hypothetical protein
MSRATACLSGRVLLAALTGTSASGGAVTTPNGRFVAFRSSAARLVPGDTSRVNDVFQRRSR